RHAESDRLQRFARYLAQFHVDALAFDCIAALHRSVQRKLDRLFDRFARLQCVRPWPDQGPHIGFERGVRPVAMVFHFEGVTFHQYGRLEAGHDLVSQRTDVQHRLDRVHQFRELAYYLAAVDMLDIDCLSRHALQGMEHHKAGTCGEEIGFGHRDAGEFEIALFRCFYPGVVRKFLFIDFDRRVETHRKAVAALIDFQVADYRRGGAPVLVADQKTDCTEHLDAIDPHITQLAAVQFGRQRTRLDNAPGGLCLLGAAQRNRARGPGYFHFFSFMI